MYTQVTQISDNKFRAKLQQTPRSCLDDGGESEIWLRNDAGFVIVVKLDEAANLITELTRELASAEALALGVAA